MPDQHGVSDKGGTMRLGSYLCKLGEGTLAQKMYGVSEVRERHRHRYEFNNAYREQLTAKGLVLMASLPTGDWSNHRVGIILVLGDAVSS